MIITWQNRLDFTAQQFFSIILRSHLQALGPRHKAYPPMGKN